MREKLAEVKERLDLSEEKRSLLQKNIENIEQHFQSLSPVRLKSRIDHIDEDFNELSEKLI